MDTSIEESQITRCLFPCLSEHLKYAFWVLLQDNNHVQFLITCLLSQYVLLHSDRKKIHHYLWSPNVISLRWIWRKSSSVLYVNQWHIHNRSDLWVFDFTSSGITWNVFKPSRWRQLLIVPGTAYFFCFSAISFAITEQLFLFLYRPLASGKMSCLACDNLSLKLWIPLDNKCLHLCKSLPNLLYRKVN